MSLFPAYNVHLAATSKGQPDEPCHTDWLENVSFPTEETSTPPAAVATENLRSAADAETRTEHTATSETDADAPDRQPRKRRRSPSTRDAPEVRKRRSSPDHRHKRKKRKEKHESSRHTKDKKLKRRRADQELQLKDKKQTSAKDVAARANSTGQAAPMRGVFLEDSSLRPEAAVCVDRCADRANLSAPTMYFKHVANYRRRWQRALGRPVPRSVMSSRRYYHSRFRRRVRAGGGAGWTREGEVEDFDECSSYVPLHQAAASSVAESSHAGDGDRLTILPEALEFEFREETAALQRRLAASPHSERLWLELVQFQQRRLAGRVTADQLRERQLAIVARALRECPAGVELRLCRLQLQQEQHQSPADAEREWTDLLFAHPADLTLWRRYLLYQQSAGRFALADLLAAYGRCLERLGKLRAGQLRPHRAPTHCDDFMLETLGRLCCMLRQAGYTERAVAVYQALLELNLFSPPSEALEDEARLLDAMEPYWDGRLPRLGEPHARGWSAELAERRRRPPPEAGGCAAAAQRPDDDSWEDELLAAAGEQQLPRCQLWLRMEYGREQRHWLPWDRPGEEDDCDDTDRIVSFDQVRKFVFLLPARLHVRAVEQCVWFLCGQPVPPDPDPDERWGSAESGTSLSAALAAVSTQAASSDTAQTESLLTVLDGRDVQDVLSLPPPSPTVTDSPSLAEFTKRLLDQALEVFSGRSSSDAVEKLLVLQGRLLTYRATTAIASSRKVLGGKQGIDEAAAPYVLSASTAPALATEKKTIRRQFKTLLRSARQSVPLFIQYAALERELGDAAAAARVLEAALQQAATDDLVRYRLVHRYCLLRVESCTPASAAEATNAGLTAVCALWGEYSPGARPTAVQVTRAVSRLRCSLQEALVAVSLPPLLVPATVCLGWALLLTADLLEAAALLSTVAGQLESRLQTPAASAALADLLTAGVQLVSAARPLADAASWRRSLQPLLRAALLRRPRHRALCQLAAVHLRQPWWRRVRSAAPAEAAPRLPALVELLRAADDLRRLSQRRSGSDAAREAGSGGFADASAGLAAYDTLEKASATAGAARLRRSLAGLVVQPQLQHSAPLWLLYLQLLRQCGAADFVPVCYRATQACPWSRHILLHLATGQLEAAGELLRRAGLRLRAPPEELDILLEEEPELVEQRKLTIDEQLRGLRELTETKARSREGSGSSGDGDATSLDGASSSDSDAGID